MAVLTPTCLLKHSQKFAMSCLIDGCCAECVGGVIAGMLAGPLYGVGSPFLRRALPWIKETEIVKEGGEIVDTSAPSKKDDDHHRHHKNEIYDTSGTDAPLYAGRPQSNGNHDGLTTIV